MVRRIIGQCVLYLVEVMGVSVCITFSSCKFFPIDSKIELIQRTIDFYVIYQIFIYGVLQQINDIYRDEYLAITNTYKYLKLFNKYQSISIKQDILKLTEAELNKSIFNDRDVRLEYQLIKKSLMEENYLSEEIIDVKILKYNHKMELVNLNWQFSFLLRILK